MPIGALDWRTLLKRRGILLLLGAYLGARLVVLAGGEVFTSYDTFSYAKRGDPFYDRGDLISFTGHAPRLWGTPLFYSLFGSDALRAAGQWTVATLSWGFLAWVVWGLVSHTAAKFVATAGVLVLALLNQVGNLDFAILSESLSISLGVLVLAGFLRWMATGSRLSLALLTAAAFWWTFVRPDIRVFTVFLVVVLAGIAWRIPGRRHLAAVSAGLLAVAVAWCTLIVPVAAADFEKWGALGMNQSEELFVSRLRIDVLPNPTVKAVFTDKFGMPACPAAEASAARVEWDLVEFANAYRGCPELVEWSHANMDSSFRRLAIAAPGAYLAMTADLTGQSLVGGTYAKVPTVVPGVVHRVVYPGMPWTLPVLLGVLALAIAAAVGTGAVRANPLVGWTAIGTALISAISVVAGAAVVGGFWRFGVQEGVGIRLAIIWLAAIVLDQLLDRRSGKSVPDTSPSAVAQETPAGSA
jgi:hypothetical protein